MRTTFREALIEEYRSWQRRGECPSPFAFYCALSDRIGSDYTARKKAETLLRIDAACGIVEKFLSLDPAKAMRAAVKGYAFASGILPIRPFEDLLAIFAFCSDPRRYPLCDKDRERKTASVKREKSSKPAKIKKRRKRL